MRSIRGLQTNFPSAADPTRPQLWTLAHPIRFRLFELLAEGPSTASRLARRIGDSRGVASYHLRQLERAGLIAEDVGRGTRRERWWRRPEGVVHGEIAADAEGRQLTARMFATFVAREEEARHRFLTGDPDPAWHEGTFFGNWFLDVTPQEARELARRLLELVHEARSQRSGGARAGTALVSINILPWLE